MLVPHGCVTTLSVCVSLGCEIGPLQRQEQVRAGVEEQGRALKRSAGEEGRAPKTFCGTAEAKQDIENISAVVCWF